MNMFFDSVVTLQFKSVTASGINRMEGVTRD